MKVLHLTLTKKWFDMILSGEKKEEYREIKPYWCKRLVDSSEYPSEEKDDYRILPDNICFDLKIGHDVDDVLKSYFSKIKTFDVIRFTNGYSKDAPTFDIECDGIKIDYGLMIWGAEKGTKYFVLSLGKILSTNHIKQIA